MYITGILFKVLLKFQVVWGVCLKSDYFFFFWGGGAGGGGGGGGGG